MPCYTTIAADLATGKYDLATLERVVKSLGYDACREGPELLFWRDEAGRAARGSYSVGAPIELLAPDATRAASALGELRAVYTREAVTAAARRHGLKIEVDKHDPTVIRLRTDGRTGR